MDKLAKAVKKGYRHPLFYVQSDAPGKNFLPPSETPSAFPVQSQMLRERKGEKSGRRRGGREREFEARSAGGGSFVVVRVSSLNLFWWLARKEEEKEEEDRQSTNDAKSLSIPSIHLARNQLSALCQRKRGRGRDHGLLWEGKEIH